MVMVMMMMIMTIESVEQRQKSITKDLERYFMERLRQDFPCCMDGSMQAAFFKFFLLLVVSSKMLLQKWKATETCLFFLAYTDQLSGLGRFLASVSFANVLLPLLWLPEGTGGSTCAFSLSLTGGASVLHVFELCQLSFLMLKKDARNEPFKWIPANFWTTRSRIL
jgi:hypothetical protein